MAKDKPKSEIVSVSTVLSVDKECKNSIRFSSAGVNESVLTTVYVLNDALTELGNPKKIEVSIRAVE